MRFSSQWCGIHVVILNQYFFDNQTKIAPTVKRIHNQQNHFINCQCYNRSLVDYLPHLFNSLLQKAQGFDILIPRFRYSYAHAYVYVMVVLTSAQASLMLVIVLVLVLASLVRIRL